jgi:uncharacterized membrane protein YcaP (DUF421 family)
MESMTPLLNQLTQLVGNPLEILFTILRVIAVYVLLLLALRFTGRRQLGQLTPYDLVTLLLLSNVVQNAMVGGDTSLVGGLLGAFTLLALNTLISRITPLRNALEGKPVILISKGVVDRDNVRRENVSMSELEEALREHGVAKLEDTELVVLESDGNISVIANHEHVKRIRKIKSSRNR